MEKYSTLLDAKKSGAPVISYGVFLNTTIEFLIVAVCVFALVKVVNRIKRPEVPAAPPTPPKTEVLLEEIRDLLKK